MTLADLHMHLVDDYHLGPCPYTPERVEEYVRAAEGRGLAEIGVTDHCHRFAEFRELFRPVYEGKRRGHPAVAWLQDNLYEPLDRYFEALVLAKQRGLPVKIGLEVDWFSHAAARGAEEEIRAILAPYPLDYVLGSVHFLDDWPVDVSADYGWDERTLEETYALYFSALRDAAASGLYDVLAHPDLVKKFGFRIQDPTPHYDATLDAVERAGIALEVSTAGLHYPAGELYPAPEFLERALGRGIPVTFASDAHRPEDVGRDFASAVEAVRAAGGENFSTFVARRREARPLPSDLDRATTG